MKPTKILNLVITAAVFLLATAVLVPILMRNGYPSPSIPARSNITIGVVIVVLAALGWPALRYRRELAKKLADPQAKHPRRLSPMYAIRVLALARSSEIFGAIVAGGVGGILIAQFMTPVGPGASFAGNLTSCVLAVVLTVVGYLVEQLLRIKDDAEHEDANDSADDKKRAPVKTEITPA